MEHVELPPPFGITKGEHALSGFTIGENEAGVVGTNQDADGIGVAGGIGPGAHSGPNTFGYLGCKDPQFKLQAGVYGQSDHLGVIGLTTSGTGTGVFGGSTSASGGAGIGVRGETINGAGVQGRSFGSGPAGRFLGNVEVTGKLDAPRLDDLEQHSAALEQRIDILEQKIGKLIQFMDLTFRQPVHELNITQPRLEPIQGDIMIGHGFRPNSPLTIRIAQRDGFMRETTQDINGRPCLSDAFGSLQITISRGGLVGPLFFAVTDGQTNPFDWTGLLWSNTAQG